jgi:hypothetical protein
MINRRLFIVFIGLALFFALRSPAIAPAQNLRDLIQERALRHPRFWAVHHSVISQDGTFVKLFRQGASTDSNSTSSNDATAGWSFQVVPLTGDSHDLALPGFPSLFAFGESNYLFVAIPDPEAWKNREPGKLPANAKTKLYIIHSPYDGAALTSASAHAVDITGFVGSLRVRDIGDQVLAYMTVRNLNENPSLDTEESEIDHHLVVVDSLGNIVKDVELKTGPGKGIGIGNNG